MLTNLCNHITGSKKPNPHKIKNYRCVAFCLKANSWNLKFGKALKIFENFEKKLDFELKFLKSYKFLANFGF